MKILSALLVAVSSLSFFSPTDSFRSSPATVMFDGEELVYEVSWSFFKLGIIRVKTLPPTQTNSRSVYSAAAYSDSYDLPFVDLHSYSTSEMDSALFSEGASLYENSNGKGRRQTYRFIQSTNMYVTENAEVSNVNSEPIHPPIYDTLKLSSNRFQDGTSILYFARAHVHDRRGIRIPTLVRGKAGYTNFYMPCEQTSEEIDAVPFPIKVVELEGKAEFEGVFGFTGDFVGRFSDDDAAVPIKAKMKVILGSITLELKEWKRAGWSPLKAE